jgi:hypothetical protein
MLKAPQQVGDRDLLKRLSEHVLWKMRDLTLVLRGASLSARRRKTKQVRAVLTLLAEQTDDGMVAALAIGFLYVHFDLNGLDSTSLHPFAQYATLSLARANDLPGYEVLAANALAGASLPVALAGAHYLLDRGEMVKLSAASEILRPLLDSYRPATGKVPNPAFASKARVTRDLAQFEKLLVKHSLTDSVHG